METLKYTAFNLLPATPLTASYVASSAIGPKPQVNPTDQNQLMLYLKAKLSTLTTISVIVEFSADKITWYQETLDETTAGSGVVTERLVERQIKVDGNYRVAIPIKDQYIRIKVKGNAAVLTSEIKADVILGTA